MLTQSVKAYFSHKDYKYFWKWKKKIICEIIGGAVAYPVL